MAPIFHLLSTNFHFFRHPCHHNFHIIAVNLQCPLSTRGETIRPAYILVIENNEAVAKKEMAALEEAGYKVVRVADTLDGIKKLYESYPDLIILGRELLTAKGEDPYLRLRQASYLPIIVLGGEEDAAEVLELGADAYMTRKTNLSELVARVQAVLRRKMWLGTEDIPSHAGVRNQEDNRNGNGVSYLSAIELRLASCLVLNKGKLLEYQRLINEVWGAKGVSIDTLHFYMRRLRLKLQAYFPHPINILNYRGVGYCLIDEFEDGPEVVS